MVEVRTWSFHVVVVLQNDVVEMFCVVVVGNSVLGTAAGSKQKSLALRWSFDLELFVTHCPINPTIQEWPCRTAGTMKPSSRRDVGGWWLLGDAMVLFVVGDAHVGVG